jgi:hypothetical protein
MSYLSPPPPTPHPRGWTVEGKGRGGEEARLEYKHINVLHGLSVAKNENRALLQSQENRALLQSQENRALLQSQENHRRGSG